MKYFEDYTSVYFCRHKIRKRLVAFFNCKIGYNLLNLTQKRRHTYLH